MVTLGAMIGFQAGAFLSKRAKVLWLKMVMATILTGVAIQYLIVRAL